MITGKKDIQKWIKQYLHIEVIALIIVIGLCIYAYFKYDRNRIKIIDIDYSVLLPIKSKKRKRHRGVWKMQEKCRSIFEKIFNRKFPSVRPDFLKNPVTGQNLELDGYCADLKLAFEYDGQQHSKYSPYFHKSGPKEFIYQVTKDDFKTKKCKLEGINLIRIPHYIHSEKLERYIKKQLKIL